MADLNVKIEELEVVPEVVQEVPEVQEPQEVKEVQEPTVKDNVKEQELEIGELVVPEEKARGRKTERKRKNSFSEELLDVLKRVKSTLDGVNEKLSNMGGQSQELVQKQEFVQKQELDLFDNDEGDVDDIVKNNLYKAFNSVKVFNGLTVQEYMVRELFLSKCVNLITDDVSIHFDDKKAFKLICKSRNTSGKEITSIYDRNGFGSLLFVVKGLLQQKTLINKSGASFPSFFLTPQAISNIKIQQIDTAVLSPFLSISATSVPKSFPSNMGPQQTKLQGLITDDESIMLLTNGTVMDAPKDGILNYYLSFKLVAICNMSHFKE